MRRLIGAALAAVWLNGCATLSSTSGYYLGAATGPGVPVVFINPSTGLSRHIFLFAGYGRVGWVPGPGGKWVLNRRPLLEFKVAPASGDNWYEEHQINLPAHSVFTVYEQPERFWGRIAGPPSAFSFRTGSHPWAVTYWRPTPLGGYRQAGAVIWLSYMDPSGPDRLRFHYQWHPGLILKEWLFGWPRR